MPDWRQDVDGARFGRRSLGSAAYDGRMLGYDVLRKLQRPVASFNAPIGMMISPLDCMHTIKTFRSIASYRYMAELVRRSMVDLVRYGRGNRLTMGNALVARLLRSAMGAGVTLWTETPAVRLERAGRRVNCLVARYNGKDLRVAASCRCYGGCPSGAGLRSCGCEAANPQPGAPDGHP